MNSSIKRALERYNRFFELKQVFAVKFEADPILDQDASELSEHNDRLKQIAHKLEATSKPITETKDEKKSLLCEALIDLLRIIKRYCKYNNINTFNDLIKIPPYTLRKLGDLKLIIKASYTLELMNENPEVVTNSGITPEAKTAFETALEEVRSLIDKPELFRSEHHQYILEGVSIAKTMNDIFNNRFYPYLIGKYRKTDAEFCSEFKQVIKMPRSSHRTLALKGKILNAATMEPLRSVTISIDNNGTYRRGGTTGAYQFQNLTPGEHTLHFSKNGFLKQTQSILIPDEDTLVLDIQLQPSQNGD